ncbi:ACT domain-containing protein [Selenomonas sp. TAMA-11512]|uniref:ACT domain-containing protein n=1 Tax=Selenomonas sp. TAMA-11512 TaxID=3095337 RepID=UPI003090E87D|nr:ACT domain-containing protein [Selenomonas sp. TAMA-11512]
MKLVVTIVGRDQVGIVAMVSAILAEEKVNILNINQNIMDGFFNMVMIAEMKEDVLKLADLQKLLKEKGDTMGLEIKVQRQDIFKVMHSIDI